MPRRKKSGTGLILAQPGCARAKKDVELHSQKNVSPLTPPTSTSSHTLPSTTRPLIIFLLPLSYSLSCVHARTRAFVHTHSMTANGRGRSPPAQRAPQLRGAHILALVGARAARNSHFSKRQQTDRTETPVTSFKSAAHEPRVCVLVW